MRFQVIVKNKYGEEKECFILEFNDIQLAAKELRRRGYRGREFRITPIN